MSSPRPSPLAPRPTSHVPSKTLIINMKKTSESIVRLMAEKYALDISIFSETFIENTLESRLQSNYPDTSSAYQLKLETDPNEALFLKKAFSNSYSAFFRNPLTFSMLHQFVLPKIIGWKVKNHDPEIRIWSAGCAAGQEAYTLAILLDNLVNKSPGSMRYHVFGTDNSAPELEAARRGIYDYEAIKNIPFEYVQDYFLKTGDVYAIKDRIKKQVEFSDFDLLDGESSSPPSSIFGDFDLVMCSNVLFYYKPEFQMTILAKFFRTISEGGFLATGEAEVGIVNAARGFRQYMTPAPLFVKS